MGEHWDRAPRRTRRLFIAVFTAEAVAAIVLLAVYGFQRGLVIFLVALLPIVLVCLAIGLGTGFWRGLRAARRSE